MLLHLQMPTFHEVLTIKTLKALEQWFRTGVSRQP